MKIFFSAVVIFFLSVHSFAQITVTSTDFVSNSDTVLISAVTDFTNITYQNTGANINWDYSWVTIDSQRVDTFFSVGSSNFIYQLAFNNFLNPSYQASYFLKADAGLLPTGGLPIAIENPILFDKVSSSKFERVGLGAELNGIAIPIVADTIDVVYEFPMTYQDSWTSNSYMFFDLNPTFNAMFKRHQSRSSVVDGYGIITTTFGTFECIRVKSNLIYTDSLFFDLLGTGGQWLPMPTQPETQYQWIAKNQKIPVMTIHVTNSLAGPVISKVEMRDSYGVAGIIETHNSSAIQVYPNPTNNYIYISGLTQFSQLTITDINGKVFYQSNSNSNSLEIDCSKWTSGTYIAILTSNEKTVSKKIILQ